MPSIFTWEVWTSIPRAFAESHPPDQGKNQEFFDGIVRYPNLEYLILSYSLETVVPPCMLCNLTNLTHLRGLWLYYGTTNIPPEIWGIRTLEELLLVVNTVELPDGISRLPQLRRLTIKVSSGETLRRLPRDMAQARIEALTLLSVHGVDRVLPVLPDNLRLLSLGKC